MKEHAFTRAQAVMPWAICDAAVEHRPPIEPNWLKHAWKRARSANGRGEISAIEDDRLARENVPRRQHRRRSRGLEGLIAQKSSDAIAKESPTQEAEAQGGIPEIFSLQTKKLVLHRGRVHPTCPQAANQCPCARTSDTRGRMARRFERSQRARVRKEAKKARGQGQRERPFFEPLRERHLSRGGTS